MERKVNLVKWKAIGLLGITILMLCSCGGESLQRGDSGAREGTASSGAAGRLTEGRVQDETDLDIGEHHYEWIRYCRDGEGIRILGLRTKEDILVIPAEFRGYPVRSIGGSDEEMDPAGVLDEDHIVYSYMKKLLPWNLGSKNRLKKIIVSEGIRKIVGTGFAWVMADQVVLPESLAYIDEFSFIHSRVGKVVVQSKTARLESLAFSSSHMKEIEFPDDFQGEIGLECFVQSSLETFKWPAIELKRGIFSYHIFGDCKNLKEITFLENQKKIEISDNEFINCPKLTSLTFPATTGEVRYGHGPYADNYKEGGVETLVFLGKDTKLKCCDDEGREIPGYIPTGKIIAPKGSKAIQFAKKAKKASYLAPDVSGAATENENGDDECYAPLDNYMREAGEKAYKGKIKLVPVEYEER